MKDYILSGINLYKVIDKNIVKLTHLQVFVKIYDPDPSHLAQNSGILLSFWKSDATEGLFSSPW